jgi:anti-sigma factor RsiW
MMHDCRTAQERLIDLVFKELDEEQSRRLLSELEACPECREQHRSISLTLFAFDQATASTLPQENFWSEYHEKLERRLDAAERETPRTQRSAVPLWKRFIATSIRVPAPVAALAVLLLTVSSLYALMRPSNALVQKVPAAAAAAVLSDERTRIVEVPVIQEKLVTRTVYVARNNRALKNEARQRGLEPQVATRRADAPATQDAQDASLTTARDSRGKIESTHAALAGFKPTGEVKLRIIKGSYQDEK